MRVTSRLVDGACEEEKDAANPSGNDEKRAPALFFLHRLFIFLVNREQRGTAT